MTQRTKLLVAGVIAIVIVALAPFALRHWREHAWEQERLRIEEEDRQEAERILHDVEVTRRQVACLERLQEAAEKGEIDIAAEIERCRRLSRQEAPSSQP
jgi:hypothetical protein